MSEVERFDTYYGYPSCRATGRHIHANGEFVLASDYDALKEYTDQIESAESLCADVYESLKSERDALAAELEAVKAELARVKAESLRVVELPADYEFMPDWYMTPDGLGWNSSDRHGDSCVETPDGYHQFVDCKKVRLEAWESSNEAD